MKVPIDRDEPTYVPALVKLLMFQARIVLKAPPGARGDTAIDYGTSVKDDGAALHAQGPGLLNESAQDKCAYTPFCGIATPADVSRICAVAVLVEHDL